MAKLSRGKEGLAPGAPVESGPSRAVQLRPPFVEVEVAEPPRGQPPLTTGLELHLSNGHRLQVGVGFDAPTLRRLLDVLQEGC